MQVLIMQLPPGKCRKKSQGLTSARIPLGCAIPVYELSWCGYTYKLVWSFIIYISHKICTQLWCGLYCCADVINLYGLRHILQGCFTGTGAIIWLPQCQWSNPEGYGWNKKNDQYKICTLFGNIKQHLLTTEHDKSWAICNSSLAIMYLYMDASWW